MTNKNGIESKVNSDRFSELVMTENIKYGLFSILERDEEKGYRTTILNPENGYIEKENVFGYKV